MRLHRLQCLLFSKGRYLTILHDIRCIVSLGVSNPLSYEKNMFVRNNSVAKDDESPSKQFQSVCSFIALAAESGFPIEVAVLEGNDAAQASELAKSLGAVYVHTFPSPLGKH